MGISHTRQRLDFTRVHAIDQLDPLLVRNGIDVEIRYLKILVIHMKFSS